MEDNKQFIKTVVCLYVANDLYTKQIGIVESIKEYEVNSQIYDEISSYLYDLIHKEDFKFFPEDLEGMTKYLGRVFIQSDNEYTCIFEEERKLNK